jgi:hypothetical protein
MTSFIIKLYQISKAIALQWKRTSNQGTKVTYMRVFASAGKRNLGIQWLNVLLAME